MQIAAKKSNRPSLSEAKPLVRPKGATLIAGFLIRFLSLVLVASFFFGGQAVFAEEGDAAAPPAGGAPASDSAKKSPIDETFDVSKHLTTEGQENSKFAPGKKSSLGEGEEGPLAEGEAQRDETNIGIFLVDVIDLLVKLIGSVALIVFILGALLTVTSEGKEDRLEKGKTAMLYALIGLIIAFFSFIIVSFVQSIFF